MENTLYDTISACAKSGLIIGTAQHMIAPQRMQSIYQDLQSGDPCRYIVAAANFVGPFVPPVLLTLWGIYKGRKQQQQIYEQYSDSYGGKK